MTLYIILAVALVLIVVLIAVIKQRGGSLGGTLTFMLGMLAAVAVAFGARKAKEEVDGIKRKIP